jgi:hypothetical protein
MAGGKSSTAQNTTSQDNRVVVGQSGVNANNSIVSVSNTTTDLGAVHDSFAFGRESTALALGSMANVAGHAMDSNERVTEMAIGAAQDAYKNSTSQVLDSLNSTETLVANAYNDAKGRGAMTDKILIGAIVMTGLVAYAAIRGKKE